MQMRITRTFCWDLGEKNVKLPHSLIKPWFRYAGVPSVNSIESIYNFQVRFKVKEMTNDSILHYDKSLLCQDKPWVYAHLLEIQRRVGKENFPLIEQAFYPSHRDMVNIV